MLIDAFSSLSFYLCLIANFCALILYNDVDCRDINGWRKYLLCHIRSWRWFIEILSTLNFTFNFYFPVWFICAYSYIAAPQAEDKRLCIYTHEGLKINNHSTNKVYHSHDGLVYTAEGKTFTLLQNFESFSNIFNTSKEKC